MNPLMNPLMPYSHHALLLLSLAFALELPAQSIRFAAKKPVIPRGEKTELEWKVDSLPKGAIVTITPDVGEVGAKGKQPVKPQTSTTYTLTIKMNGGPDKSASVMIHVQGTASGGDNTMGLDGSRITGRRFLLGNEKEDPGLGLYSYFLLSQKPANDERAVEALAAIVRKVDALSSLSNIEPKNLNGLFIPVLKPVGEPAAGKEVDFARKALKQYNYARAKQILGALQAQYITGGPYLLSWRSPVTGQTVAPPYLVHDLGGLEIRSIPTTVDYFLRQAYRNDPWSQSGLEMLAQKMRNYLNSLSQSSINVVVQFTK